MDAGIIIGLLAFLAFLAFIGYSIYNIESDTGCDSSKCVEPGGTWFKDKCTCSCNPGYSGVNCETKSKHVSDLETACKDTKGLACGVCLQKNIALKLKGSATDVKEFKDDLTNNISSYNNICCQKNCSNSSGTLCDKCVTMTDKDKRYIFGEKTYEINNMGCLSYSEKNESGGITKNNIAKNNICNSSGIPDSKNMPKCPIGGGVVKKCSIINEGVNDLTDFTHRRFAICPKISTNNNGVNYPCVAPTNDEYSAGKKYCLQGTEPCLAPMDPDAVDLYNTDKCSKNGWPDGDKCICAGSDAKGVNPTGYSSMLAKNYTGPKCETTCVYTQGSDGQSEFVLHKGCPCGDDSPGCVGSSCNGKTGTNNPGRTCR